MKSQTYGQQPNNPNMPPQPMPTRQVVKKGNSGGMVLAAFGLILATLILTVGVIVGVSMLSINSNNEEPKVEENEPMKKSSKDSTTKKSGSKTATPLANIDANGQATGTATASIDDNPTQSFFASKGTLSGSEALGYLGQKLNEEPQRLYLQLHAAVESGRDNVDMIEVYDETSIKSAWEALFDDHPEFFWLDGNYQYVYDKNAHTLSVKFGLGVQTYELSNYRQQIEAKVTEFQQMLPVGASQYDIALKAYEYIIYHTEYDENAPYNQNIVSVFLNGRSVCAGYARAYQYLLHRSGMFCALVRGMGHTESGVDESHAWNLINIDGIPTYVDTTWGDKNPKMTAEGQANWGEIRYAFFGMTTADLMTTGHTFTTPEIWPQCDSYELNFYKRLGMLWTGYNRETFQGLVQQNIAAEKNVMEFQFVTADAYQVCLTDLNTEECLEDLPRWLGSSRASWSILSNANTRTIKFTWTTG